MNRGKSENPPSAEESPPETAVGQKPSVGLYGVRDEAQFVGPYKILEILGHGGQATVHRAFDPRVGRVVALKVLRSVVGPTSELLLRFRREAEMTAKLDCSATITPPR